jgi:hypothetical protein
MRTIVIFVDRDLVAASGRDSGFVVFERHCMGEKNTKFATLGEGQVMMVTRDIA